MLDLQTTLALLKQLFEVIPFLISIQDVNGQYLDCNLRFASAFGYHNTEMLIGKKITDICHNIKQALIVYSNEQETIKLGCMKSYEETITLADQTELFLLSKRIPLQDAQNSQSPILVSFYCDITNSVQEKVSTIQNLENIIAYMPGHVYWLNKDNVFLGCNDLQAYSAGFSSRKEIVGKTNYDLPWKEEAEELDKVNLEVMETGVTQEVEETIHLSDGQEAIYWSQKVPLRNAQGEVNGILGISFNITERKQTEVQLALAKEKAEAANVAKSLFIAGISHDLRTPLSSILGSVEILKARAHYQEQQEFFDDIINGSRRLSKLVEDVLKYAKFETTNYEPKMEKVSFSKLAQNIIKMIEPIASQKGLKICFEQKNLPTYLMLDTESLSRILTNLLENAVKFTNKGQITLQVNFSIVKGMSALIFSVEDTGIGIPKNHLEYIFERFYRVKSSFKGGAGGLGLGLSIVKQLVEQLNGEISVISEVNQGSIFTCIIPSVMTNEESLSPLNRQPFSLEITNTPLVLLIEDDLTCQKITPLLLQELGCKTHVVGTGQEALALNLNEFDLVLLDIGLPDMDGIQVAKQFQSKALYSKQPPIIAYTAQINEEGKQECFESGIQQVLIKPVSLSAFKGLLDEYVFKESTLEPIASLEEV